MDLSKQDMFCEGQQLDGTTLTAASTNVLDFSKHGDDILNKLFWSLFVDAATNGSALTVQWYTSDAENFSSETKLFEKTYEVTPLEKKRSDFFATIPVTLGKVQINLNKRFKFRQNTVVVEVEIENLSPEKLTDFTYVNTINLARPKSLGVTCPEGEIEDNQEVFTQSAMIQEKPYPLSVSIVLGEEATIHRTDFYRKARSWLGDRTYYEYTQLKIQKKLSLEPFSETRLTIGFRTEKRKEKHNDTTEQSTS